MLTIGTKGGVPEKCEKIAIFRGNPSNSDNLLPGTIRAATDVCIDIDLLDECFDGLALTTVPRYANYHVAYIDPFGYILATKEYIPPTPDLQLTRVNLTTMKVKWTVRDRGSLDYIAFYDHKPTNQAPGNYITGTRIPALQAEDSAQRLVPPGKNIWVAYVMKDARVGISRSKILAEKGPK